MEALRNWGMRQGCLQQTPLASRQPADSAAELERGFWVEMLLIESLSRASVWCCRRLTPPCPYTEASGWHVALLSWH